MLQICKDKAPGSKKGKGQMECHADFSAESSSTYQDSAGPSHQSVSLANVSQLLDSKWRGEEVAAVQVIPVINSLVSVAWAGGAR